MVDPGQINLPAITVGSIYSCPFTVGTHDVVYQTGPGTADTADCTGPVAKGPALGVVAYKPTATSCYVVQGGLVAGFPPATFIPKETLYMGPLGELVRGTVLPGVPGTIIQEVGYAKSDTEVMVILDRDWYDI